MSDTEWAERLGALWVVLGAKGSSLVVISPAHAEGLVAPLYSSQEAAAQAAARVEGGGFAPYPVPSLWEVARLLAAQGCAGLLLDEALPLFFLAPQRDAAAPTHLALPDGERVLLLDEAGLSATGRAGLEGWADVAAFDRLSTRWLLGDQLPFLGYDAGRPLVEYLPEGDPRLFPDTGALLAADPAIREAIPLFSDAYAAEWYWAVQGAAPGAADGARGGQVARSFDVVARLVEYAAALPPDAAVILNPGRHRFYQGFFRQAGGAWYLVTINGVWLVDPPFRCKQVARRS